MVNENDYVGNLRDFFLNEPSPEAWNSFKEIMEGIGNEYSGATKDYIDSHLDSWPIALRELSLDDAVDAPYAPFARAISYNAGDHASEVNARNEDQDLTGITLGEEDLFLEKLKSRKKDGSLEKITYLSLSNDASSARILLGTLGYFPNLDLLEVGDKKEISLLDPELQQELFRESYCNNLNLYCFPYPTEFMEAFEEAHWSLKSFVVYVPGEFVEPFSARFDGYLYDGIDLEFKGAKASGEVIELYGIYDDDEEW